MPGTITTFTIYLDRYMDMKGIEGYVSGWDE